jgi:hypothetical protein
MEIWRRYKKFYRKVFKYLIDSKCNRIVNNFFYISAHGSRLSNNSRIIIPPNFNFFTLIKTGEVMTNSFSKFIIVIPEKNSTKLNFNI